MNTNQRKIIKNLDVPLTIRGFMELMDVWMDKLLLKDDAKNFLTKEDAKIFATKNDLKQFATKEDLKRFATKEDLKRFATKEDLKRFATKEDLKNFATKEDLKKCATKKDLKKVASKEDLILFKDAILGELKAIREEQTVGAYQLADHSDRLENMEKIHPGNAHKMGLNRA